MFKNLMRKMILNIFKEEINDQNHNFRALQESINDIDRLECDISVLQREVNKLAPMLHGVANSNSTLTVSNMDMYKRFNKIEELLEKNIQVKKPVTKKK